MHACLPACTLHPPPSSYPAMTLANHANPSCDFEEHPSSHSLVTMGEPGQSHNLESMCCRITSYHVCLPLPPNPPTPALPRSLSCPGETRLCQWGSAGENMRILPGSIDAVRHVTTVTHEGEGRVSTKATTTEHPISIVPFVSATILLHRNMTIPKQSVSGQPDSASNASTSVA